MNELVPVTDAVEPRRPQRMRLAMLDIVNRTADMRRALQHKLDLLKASRSVQNRPSGISPVLRIEIGNELQDEAMTALVLPHIEAELCARIASCDRDLEAYGVDVS